MLTTDASIAGLPTRGWVEACSILLAHSLDTRWAGTCWSACWFVWLSLSKPTDRGTVEEESCSLDYKLFSEGHSSPASPRILKMSKNSLVWMTSLMIMLQVSLHLARMESGWNDKLAKSRTGKGWSLAWLDHLGVEISNHSHTHTHTHTHTTSFISHLLFLFVLFFPPESNSAAGSVNVTMCRILITYRLTWLVLFNFIVSQGFACSTSSVTTLIAIFCTSELSCYIAVWEFRSLPLSDTVCSLMTTEESSYTRLLKFNFFYLNRHLIEQVAIMGVNWNHTEVIRCKIPLFFSFFWGCVPNYIGGTFQATARFQGSDIFQKAYKIALRCVLSVHSHLSGVRLYLTWSHPCNYLLKDVTTGTEWQILAVVLKGICSTFIWHPAV